MGNLDHELMAVSPIDGRYAAKTAELQPIVSEYGLIERRVQVAAAWVGVLGSGVLPDKEPLSDQAQEALAKIPAGFTLENAKEVKAIEKKTNHDANAAVRWMKDRMAEDPGLSSYTEFVHFGATSEDLNNIATALMVRDARDRVLMPGIIGVRDILEDKAEEYADLPQLARTHGQPASPTTHGKEWEVYASRINKHIAALGAVSIEGKFNGATGNYSAATFAYPEVDWPAAARKLVTSFGLEFNGVTTQIESHDWMSRFFRELALGNTIMTGLARDVWTYVMLEELTQEADPDHDGSSAMPNKVNPIDAENAEANFGLGNALLDHLAAKLPISRLQRDLSDSSAIRAVGQAFGHTAVAHKSLQASLKKVYPNTTTIVEHLDEQYAVLMEPVQTVMRRYGIEGAYDQIKQLSRGLKMGRAQYIELVEGLDIPDESKIRLLTLTPAKYTGRANQIARRQI